jgi:hypothetical protein
VTLRPFYPFAATVEGADCDNEAGQSAGTETGSGGVTPRSLEPGAGARGALECDYRAVPTIDPSGASGQGTIEEDRSLRTGGDCETEQAAQRDPCADVGGDTTP